MTTQLREVLCTEIGELILFPVAPYVFDGVEFRRVCRESFQRDATALLRHELLDQSATVSRKPIPNDEKIGTDVALSKRIYVLGAGPSISHSSGRFPSITGIFSEAADNRRYPSES